MNSGLASSTVVDPDTVLIVHDFGLKPFSISRPHSASFQYSKSSTSSREDRDGHVTTTKKAWDERPWDTTGIHASPTLSYAIASEQHNPSGGWDEDKAIVDDEDRIAAGGGTEMLLSAVSAPEIVTFNFFLYKYNPHCLRSRRIDSSLKRM